MVEARLDFPASATDQAEWIEEQTEHALQRANSVGQIVQAVEKLNVAGRQFPEAQQEQVRDLVNAAAEMSLAAEQVRGCAVDAEDAVRIINDAVAGKSFGEIMFPNAPEEVKKG